MASRGYPYTLSGFSEEVDRRPLFFVLPLPATRVCNACGLVPHVKALLPCEHSFCKPCYEQCEAEGVVACPLDADACSAEEVTWVNHPARSILAKQVLCWNQASGCNVTTAAADLPRHFFHECTHHVARCPKCDMDTLAANVCAHLQSHFGPSSAPRAATDHRTQTVPEEREPLPMTSPEAANGTSTALSAKQDQLIEIIDALKIIAAAPTAGHGETDAGNWEARLLQETLSQMRIQIGKLKDHLDGLIQNINANQQTFHNSFVERNEALKQCMIEAAESSLRGTHLTEQISELRQQMGVLHYDTKAELDRMSVAIASQCDRMCERFRVFLAGQETHVGNVQERPEANTETLAQNASKIAWAQSVSAAEARKILARVPWLMPVSTTHTWLFEGYGLLKNRVEEGYGAVAILRAVYLRGYYVSVGLCLAEDSTVCFFFQLHKGKLDQFLEWPFNLKIRFTIAHPRGFEKLSCCKMPRMESPAGYVPFLRPLGVTNVPDCVQTTLSAQELEKQGFIKDGGILLNLALEPLGNVAT